jgi:hypothetical protein
MVKNLQLRYWIIPFLTLIVLIGMYFSGVKWAQEIICPTVDWELGIVENIQLALLLLIFIVAVIAVKKKKLKIERFAFLVLSVFSLFVFLEEIDYGNHFLMYFKGQDNTVFSDLTGKLNVHNMGNNAKLFKRSVYPLMGILFMVAPLVRDRISNPLLRYLLPCKWIITTAIYTLQL